VGNGIHFTLRHLIGEFGSGSNPTVFLLIEGSLLDMSCMIQVSDIIKFFIP